MATAKRVILTSWQCPSCFTRVPIVALRPGLQPSNGNGNGNRSYSKSIRNLDEAHRPVQALPLSGYYADIISSSTPSQPSVSTRVPADTAKTKAKEDRARVVFGSRLAGSGYERRSSETPDATWRTINGVLVPPRPAEPDNCCMSGCVHCVWDDYRDEVEGWAMRLREARLQNASAGSSIGQLIGAKVEKQKTEVIEASTSMDDDGGGRETNWEADDAVELFASIPVGIREFMRTEKRLRDRRKIEA